MKYQIHVVQLLIEMFSPDPAPVLCVGGVCGAAGPRAAGQAHAWGHHQVRPAPGHLGDSDDGLHQHHQGDHH